MTIRSMIVVVGAVFAAAASTLLSSPAAANATPNGVTCTPVNKIKYTNEGTTWLSYDAGSIKNTSSAGVTRSITHSSSYSKKTSISGSAGISIGDSLVGINAKFGWSAAKSASYTKTTTFTVKVPAHTSVSYQSGVVNHEVGLDRYVIYSSCVKTNSYGTLNAVEYEDVVKNS